MSARRYEAPWPKTIGPGEPPMLTDPRAACRATPDVEFFPDLYNEKTCAAPKAVCARCPLRDNACLVWALANERHGVFAGLSPIERGRRYGGVTYDDAKYRILPADGVAA